MAVITYLGEVNNFDGQVPTFQADAILDGGLEAQDNMPLQALVNRTRWLKGQVDALLLQIANAAQVGDSYTKMQSDALFAPIQNGVFPGMGMPHFGLLTVVPAGWLLCDGTAVSRTTYAALFAAIGTLWGAGDGVTTFNLPDARGQFLRGLDRGRGVDPGRTMGSNQLGTLVVSDPSAYSTTVTGLYNTGADAAAFQSRLGYDPFDNRATTDIKVTSATASIDPTTVEAACGIARPPNIPVNYLIKT